VAESASSTHTSSTRPKVGGTWPIAAGDHILNASPVLRLILRIPILIVTSMARRQSTMTRRQKRALAALNLDLFNPENLAPPAPATIYTKIAENARSTMPVMPASPEVTGAVLPDVAELYRLFERFNWLYFEGKLPQARIEYSNRMRAAGSYTPRKRLIRIGRKYHELFPGEIADTLKHEMIHIRHFYHNAEFKTEARRLGVAVKARSHPDLQRQPKYIYVCERCGQEYPRQRRLRMASCGICTPGSRFDPRFKLKLKRETT